MRNNQNTINRKEAWFIFAVTSDGFMETKIKLQGAANINQISYETQHIEARLPQKSSQCTLVLRLSWILEILFQDLLLNNLLYLETSQITLRWFWCIFRQGNYTGQYIVFKAHLCCKQLGTLNCFHSSVKNCYNFSPFLNTFASTKLNSLLCFARAHIYIVKQGVKSRLSLTFTIYLVFFKCSFPQMLVYLIWIANLV